MARGGIHSELEQDQRQIRAKTDDLKQTLTPLATMQTQ